MKTLMLLAMLLALLAIPGQCQVNCDSCGCCQDYNFVGPTNCAGCHMQCHQPYPPSTPWCESCGDDCSNASPIITSGVVPKPLRGRFIATKSHLQPNLYVVLLKGGMDANKGKPPAHPVPSRDPMSTWAAWVSTLPPSSPCSLVKAAQHSTEGSR